MDECINEAVVVVTECPCLWGPCKGAGREIPYRGLWGKDIAMGIKCTFSGYLYRKGPRWGTWRGFVLRDFFRENDSISGFISVTERTLRI